MIVVATTEDQVPAALDDLRRLGVEVDDAEILLPSGTRRLLLSPEPDGAAGHRVVTGLRKKGYPSVLRPATGPQLEAWVRHTRPVVVGGRLTVAFVWSEHARSGLPNVVELDPAGGFGSAQHPATHQILAVLAARIAGGERVLDVGCGNGILGLSALRLGATRLSAVDIDPAAVDATRRNAEINALSHLLESHEIGDDPFDAVVANIGRSALADLGPELARRVGPAGWLVASGFSPPQCDVVAASLRPLEIIERHVAGEWAALTVGRQ